MKYNEEKIEQMLRNFGWRSKIESSLKARLLAPKNTAGKWALGFALCACAAALLFLPLSKKPQQHEEYVVITAQMLDNGLGLRFEAPQTPPGPLVISEDLLDKKI